MGRTSPPTLAQPLSHNKTPSVKGGRAKKAVCGGNVAAAIVISSGASPTQPLGLAKRWGNMGLESHVCLVLLPDVLSQAPGRNATQDCLGQQKQPL